MTNGDIHRKKIILQILILVIGLAIAPTITSTLAEHVENNQYDIKTITFSKHFSSPIIDENEEYTKINMQEENSCIIRPGEPRLPVFTKIFEFTWGTEITDIKYTISNVKTKSIEKKVEPASSRQNINDNLPIKKEINQEIYNSNNPYPTNQFSYTEGTGLNKNGERVLFLSIHTYPVQYIPLENTIKHIDDIQMTITYKEPEITNTNAGTKYDLVIITPSQFSSSLTPLINHKNSHKMNTTLK
ncbi:MAG: C25 family peptidase propeptide domain-containing protein, partial [Candidatus Thermoplasmatota archaeon]|nr:C25 family peptidase propeptide domain-containing protein [Candidatus Thermoplasmatota archaeon]